MKTTDDFEHMILEDINSLNEIQKNTKSGKIMLHELLENKNISISKLGNQLGMSSYIYEVLNLNNTKQISRNKLLSILFVLQADLKSFNEILQKFGHSKIYVKVEFDAILFYCINNKYTLEQTNELLSEKNFEIL